MNPEQLVPIPEELKARRQWVVWKTEWRGGKATKVPYNARTGERAASDDPQTWSSFEEAVRALPSTDGIGFMWSADDPYAGVDLDGCRDPVSGKMEAWAQRWVDLFYTYTEVSPSGTGVHLIVRGTWKGGWNKKPVAEAAALGHKDPAIEAYDRRRYFAFTGNPMPGLPLVIAERQPVLDELHAAFATAPKEGKRRRPLPLEMADTDLLEVARNAVNGDRFRRLYDQGDTSGHGGDDSAADLALCNHLAFYCRGDEGRMDRLFRASALYREKWDRKAGEGTYGQLTLRKALADCPTFYTPPHTASGSVERARVVTADTAGTLPPKSILTNGRHPPEGLPPPKKPDIVSAGALMAKKFPEMRWAVPNMIGEGLTILAGGPKAGKSYMALAIAVAVAAGGRAFGKIPVDQGNVLYLALEDSQRRLQERLDDILQGERAPAGLDLSIEWGMLGGGFEEHLNEWLDTHERARLVVLDVFQKVRPQAPKNAQPYDEDYRVTSLLQKLALPRRVALLALHHTRKMAADDPYDLVSGTAGMTAAADGVMVLMRQRDQPDATLHFIGRDIGAQAWSLKWDDAIHTWALLGDAALHQISEQRAAIVKLMKDMDEDLGPKDIAEMIQASYGSVKRLVVKMSRDGELARTTRGKYRLPRAWTPDGRIVE